MNKFWNAVFDLTLIFFGTSLLGVAFTIFNNPHALKYMAWILTLVGICVFALGIIHLFTSVGKDDGPEYASAVLIRRDMADNIVDVYLYKKCTIKKGDLVSVYFEDGNKDMIDSFPANSVELHACDYKEGVEPSVFDGYLEYHKDVHEVSYQEFKRKNGLLS